MDAESQDSGSPVKDTKSTKAKKSTAPKKVTAKKDTKDKKTKKDGKTKDPGAPKKPRSSYLIYSIEQREVLKKENSDLKATGTINCRSRKRDHSNTLFRANQSDCRALEGIER